MAKPNNKEYGLKVVNVCENILTRYGYGGWGQSLTEANKQYFLTKYPKNASNATIKKGIESATDDYFIMDCVCGHKSILDGFCGDKTKTYGGATYGKPCPDITVEAMLKDCTDVSTNMNNMLIGEFVTDKSYGHCGVYVGLINGKRMVAEAVAAWKNGMQLIDMDCASRKGTWVRHGKMTKYIDYTYKDSTLYPAPSPADLKKELQAYVKDMESTLAKMIKTIDKI